MTADPSAGAAAAPAAFMAMIEAAAARGAAIALAEQTPPPLLHRATDIADRLSVSRDTVDRLIADGDLPTVKVRNVTLVTEQALVDYVDRLNRPAATRRRNAA